MKTKSGVIPYCVFGYEKWRKQISDEINQVLACQALNPSVNCSTFRGFIVTIFLGLLMKIIATLKLKLIRVLRATLHPWLIVPPIEDVKNHRQH